MDYRVELALCWASHAASEGVQAEGIEKALGKFEHMQIWGT